MSKRIQEETLCVELIEAHELMNPHFVRDVKNAGWRLGWNDEDFLDRLLSEHAKLEPTFVDLEGDEFWLDTEVFEYHGDDDVSDEIAQNLERIREGSLRCWFRDTFCSFTPESVRPFVRTEKVTQFLVVANILKAMDPERAKSWGVRRAEGSDSFADVARRLRGSGRRQRCRRDCPSWTCVSNIKATPRTVAENDRSYAYGAK